MDELPSGSMEGPPLPPEPAEHLLAMAEEARLRQIWEESIRLYRFTLQKDPRNVAAVMGLAAAYEGKSREPGYDSYFESALASYRKAVAMDPGNVKVHDAYLAAAVRGGNLEGLMDEYKRFAAQAGETYAHVFKGVHRKIQTLLIMQTDRIKKGPPPLPPVITFTMGVAAPIIALGCAGVGVIIRLKASSETQALIAVAFFKTAVAAFVVFVGYKLYVSWRNNR